MTEALLIFAALCVCLVGFLLAKKRNYGPDKPHLGPIIRGKNYSVGVELDGLSFDFPHPNRAAGHVHALVMPQRGPLSGKLTMRYRIEADEGVTFHPQEAPDATAIISLMIQREGDDYSARGNKAFYRLYAPGPFPIEPGDHTMTVNLDPVGWIGVHGVRPSEAQFIETTQSKVAAIHICFGGGGSRAHGVFASGPARFTLLTLT